MGDGIAKEVCIEAEKTLNYVKKYYSLPLNINKFPCGGAHWIDTGEEWPEEAKDACKESDAILFGGVGIPEATLPWGAPAGLNVIFWLRKQLDLYANVRRIRPIIEIGQKISGKYREIYDPDKIDLILVRENTEDLYTSPRGIQLVRGMVTESITDLKICTRRQSQKFIDFAFKLTRKKFPSKERIVTCIDKSNVLDSCRLFRRVFKEIAENNRDIECNYSYIDNFVLDVLHYPEKYKVCVTSNMYGDIISDLFAFFEGGSGVGAASNIGDSIALFEPMHGTKPHLAGKGLANPMGIHNCIVLMFEWLADKLDQKLLFEVADRVKEAMLNTVKEGILPVDLDGNASTHQFSAELRKRIGEEVR